MWQVLCSVWAAYLGYGHGQGLQEFLWTRDKKSQLVRTLGKAWKATGVSLGAEGPLCPPASYYTQEGTRWQLCPQPWRGGWQERG